MKKLLFLLPVLAVLFAACEKEENAIKDNGQENTGTSGSSDTSENTDSNTGNPDPISIPVGEAVDLGLSVKWANFNVGASKPEELGYYYAWGETEQKTKYGNDNYKYRIGDYKNLTKYCNKSDYGYNGFMDNKTVLDPEDDAAHVNWGSNWRIPTNEEKEELYNKCTWTWYKKGNSEFNGVAGYKIQGMKQGYTDKWIFLPATGYHEDSRLGNVESGYYWCSSLDTDNPNSAYFLNFNYWSHLGEGCLLRHIGLSIRPVCP